MSPLWPRLLGALLLFTTSLASFAATADSPDDGPEIATRFSHYYASYALNADASHVETHDWAMQVVKESAVARAKQASITYSTSIQHADVIEAYTLKADGRRIDSPKSNFQLEVNSGNARNAPVFSDLTTLTVVFPEVTVGDSVVFSYRLTQKEAMYPGQFSLIQNFPRSVVHDDLRIKIDAPTSLWAQYEGHQLTALPTVEKDGRRVLEWIYRNPQPPKEIRRNYSVYEVDQEPGFSFSTFHTQQEMAAAYAARALPKATVSERIQKLADDIAKGQKGPRDTARALYDWVAVNISYAGNCIGVGAVVPHDLDFILDNRMGDCKDHATLLQALLAAKGIASTQAWSMPAAPTACRKFRWRRWSTTSSTTCRPSTSLPTPPRPARLSACCLSASWTSRCCSPAIIATA